MTLRTKYILRIGILFLIGVMGFLWYTGNSLQQNKSRKIAPEQELATKTDPLLLAQVDVDSDGDGLRDWEESLWSTDPAKVDTDGDGISDGAEVAGGRIPTKKGPNDLMPKSIPGEVTKAELAKAQAQVATLNTTDRFARDSFTTYLGLKNSASNSTDISSILGTIVDKAENSGLPKVYSVSDIYTSSDDSVIALKKYANDVGILIYNSRIIFSYDELDTFNQALISKDYKPLRELSIPAEAYKKIATGLRSLQVPPSAKSSHLALLNSFTAISSAIGNMQNFEKDPVLGLEGLARFKESYGAMTQTVSSLRQLFEKRNIAFDQYDPAKIYIK